MNFRLLFAFAVMALTACNQHGNESEEHDEEIRFQYSTYSEGYEIYIDAEPFIAGEPVGLLAHITDLETFKPVDSCKITLILSVNGTETMKTIDQPIQTGIYHCELTPSSEGEGTLTFKIQTGNGIKEIELPGISVFSSPEEAHEASEKLIQPQTNTTAFTKEQTWKIDFSTGYPENEAFGQVIKTTALVQSSQGNEIIVSAKTNGEVVFHTNNLSEGKIVKSQETLFSISGSNLADNNISLKYSEARNNFEKAQADYERAKELVKDLIISEKELNTTWNQYENARAVYDNLSQHFSESGQRITSPMNGYIKEVLVKNGVYVDAGQPVLVISRNNTLILTADVPQKYAHLLGSVKSAIIRTLHDNRVYTLEQLNGTVESYGKAANLENYLIPVTIKIDNRAGFTPGGFVEIYLKTINGSNTVTVPNTALLEEQGIFYVWVQLTPELFEKREVITGATDGIKTEIKSGISTKERIVTRGALMIKLAQATGTLDAHAGHVH